MKRGVLEGRLVILRPLQRSFFSDYLKMFSSKVKKLLHVSSQDSELEYLEDRLQKQIKGETFFYCIFDKKEDTLVGAIEIRDIDETDSQLYSWVNEDYWSTGIYQETLNLISQAYFKQTEQTLYRANVDMTNLRSYYALKKHGFVDSGIKKGSFGKQYRLVLRKK